MITQEYLKDYFCYENGELIRIKKLSNASQLNKAIGKINRNGYVEARIGYKLYRLHRLIWLFHYGYLPEFIDHIDGNRSNNKIENLREATKSQNMHNAKMRINNTSGIKGVYWNKANKNWRVRFKIHNIFKDFGSFNNIELAELVANEVRSKYHKQFARTF